MSTSLIMSSYLARDTLNECERALRLGETLGLYESRMSGDIFLVSLLTGNLGEMVVARMER